MRKLLLICAISVLTVNFSGASFAEEGGGSCPQRHGGGMFGRMFGDKEKGSEKGECICPMHKMMVRRMMDMETLATYDGGVVVVLGNKLIKYDKDMNLVKEVEMKMDTEAMRKSMEEMKSNCPVCSKMQDKK